MLVQLRRLDMLAHTKRFRQRRSLVRRQIRQRQCAALARQRVVFTHMDADRRQP
ncbi:hypothetical protein D3C87_2181700 [compost metagenome]